MIVLPLLVLVGFLIVEGHLPSQGALVGDGKYFLQRPGVFPGELLNQGWIPESFLEEYDY
jgi:hypothetical protein